MGRIFRRLLDIPREEARSYFLWGPRKVGKTHWIRNQFKRSDDRNIDLLKTDVFAEYASRPALLRERYDGRFTIIDEVQKVPALLDEVHWLIENRGACFLLCGSSARKLRRGHANLLAGRALRYEMGPLSSLEVDGFDLERAMVSGLVPLHYLSNDPEADLRSYVADYLKEEIAAEARIRNLPAFSEFLRVAALTSSELLSYTNVAREAGVPVKAVRNYFDLLEDTLLGFRLRPWMRARRRRMTRTAKFYLFDVGVANYLARRRPIPGGTAFGKSFEHFILGEILNYRRYVEPDVEVRYWRTSSGFEIDFILGDMLAAVEVKASTRIHQAALRPFRVLSEEAEVRKKVMVSLEPEQRTVGDVTILPWRLFLTRLQEGEITG